MKIKTKWKSIKMTNKVNIYTGRDKKYGKVTFFIFRDEFNNWNSAQVEGWPEELILKEDESYDINKVASMLGLS